jgi:hypothetical protein
VYCTLQYSSAALLSLTSDGICFDLTWRDVAGLYYCPSSYLYLIRVQVRYMMRCDAMRCDAMRCDATEIVMRNATTFVATVLYW